MIDTLAAIAFTFMVIAMGIGFIAFFLVPPESEQKRKEKRREKETPEQRKERQQTDAFAYIATAAVFIIIAWSIMN